MNRIVRRNYPVARLPADLRGDIPEDAKVNVAVEEIPPQDRRKFLDLIREARDHMQFRYRSMEEIIQDIRALRDEWDR